MNNIQRDFARKRGLRMADGGGVGLSMLSMRDNVPYREPDEIGKEAGFSTTGEQPVFPQSNAPLPDATPANAGLRAAIRNPTPPTTGFDITFGSLVNQRPPTMRSGVRGATGGETEALVKSAKRRLGLRKGGYVSSYAAGGKIAGPGGPEADKVPAMLSNGEYVLPAKTVAKVGKENLDTLVLHTNDGKAPAGLRQHFAAGGIEQYTPTAEEAAALARSPVQSGTADIHADAMNNARVSAAGAPEFTPESTVARGLRAAGTPNFAAAADAAAPALRTGLRFAGDAAVPAIELGRAGVVAAHAMDPNDPTTGTDVATQVASGTSRAASTIAGAGIGATLGGPVGALIGGGLGYFGSDAAIRGGRALAGTDTADPYDRTAAQPSAATALKAPATPAAPPDQFGDKTITGHLGPNDQPTPEFAHGETDLKAAIKDAYGRNPYKGVRGSVAAGGLDDLAANVGNTLQARGNAKALQAKYGSDATLLNAQSQRAIEMARLRYDMNEKAQGHVRDAMDRMAEIPTMNKDGVQTGTTKDPLMRNRLEAYMRSNVQGYDNLAPEQQMSALESSRHGFMLNELANSGDYGTVGKFLSNSGFMDMLGSPSSSPVNVKAIRSIGVGDLGQQSAAATSILSGRPYVEFSNGKLYPLAQAMQNPDYAEALQRRMQFAPKDVQEQFKKRLGDVKVAGAR